MIPDAGGTEANQPLPLADDLAMGLALVTYDPLAQGAPGQTIRKGLDIVGILSDLLRGGRSAAPAPKCEPLAVYAPADGTVVPITEFPDDVFSQEVLGPGCGILPTGTTVFAPFNGTVIQAADTLHAVGLASEDGLELLIHVGVDTVDMAGKGFQYHVKNGQKVRLGEPLIGFDREVIKAAGHSDAIAVVVTNSDDFSGVELRSPGEVKHGDWILKGKN